VRVGLFTPNYPGVSGDGGIGTYTRDLAQALVQSGHVAQVVTAGSQSGQFLVENVPVSVLSHAHVPLLERLLPRVGASWAVGQRALKLTKDFRLDLFEFPNWEGLGIWFALRKQVPLIVRLSTSSAETQQIDGLTKTWDLKADIAREKLQAQLADGLVTHSNAHRKLMSEELGIGVARIAVIPLGVTVYPEFVRPPKTEKQLKVVFLGRLERRKGVFELLKAIPRVLEHVPNTRFILIGTDRPHCPGGRTHRQYVKDEYPANIQPSISFTGSLSDAEASSHLQTADLFVAPSLYESFGLIFLEAMRWGTPVVGTFAGGIPEIVQNGNNGVLVQPGCHEELSAAIISLLLDPERRRLLGEAGRRRVEAVFSSASMTTRTVKFYAEVMAKSTHRQAG
jgi:glycosyltransferase involved in cell wall biosynthesis